MSLDLPNVIGSFMLGSAIMYAGVSLLGHKSRCSKNVTRKNVKSILTGTKKNVGPTNPKSILTGTKKNVGPTNPKSILKSSKVDTVFTLVQTSIDKIDQNKNTFGAYVDRGNLLNGDFNRCLILSLAHIIWSKKPTTLYTKYSSDFYTQLHQEWQRHKQKPQIVSSLRNMLSKIGSGASNPEEHFNDFDRDFLNNGFLRPDHFMSIFKLCKIKSLIFLHAADHTTITFNNVNEVAGGYYIGDINENTPYIVNTGNLHFEPGVGKLNPQIIQLIKDNYIDMTNLQKEAPIQINCRGVHFSI